jgi:hypothetical protein
MENTKKGPGRPPHNAHPTTCSGEPIPIEELERKKIEAEDKKRKKQCHRQKSSSNDEKYNSTLDGSGDRKDLNSSCVSNSSCDSSNNNTNHYEHGNQQGLLNTFNNQHIEFYKNITKAISNLNNSNTLISEDLVCKTNGISANLTKNKDKDSKENQNNSQPEHQPTKSRFAYSIDSILSSSPKTTNHSVINSTNSLKKKFESDNESNSNEYVDGEFNVRNKKQKLTHSSREVESREREEVEEKPEDLSIRSASVKKNEKRNDEHAIYKSNSNIDEGNNDVEEDAVEEKESNQDETKAQNEDSDVYNEHSDETSDTENDFENDSNHQDE